MNYKKVYVDVVMRQDKEGNIIPLSLVYNDTTYEIDRISSVQRAASTKVGGTGIRYTISVMGKESFLFDEEGKWYVEAKVRETV